MANINNGFSEIHAYENGIHEDNDSEVADQRPTRLIQNTTAKANHMAPSLNGEIPMGGKGEDPDRPTEEQHIQVDLSTSDWSDIELDNECTNPNTNPGRKDAGTSPGQNSSTPRVASDRENVTANSNKSLKNEKHTKLESSIEQAKDRAQITAATSMSIVHIALLKDTLEAGPEQAPYYYFILYSIIIALALQVLAGLLALYVSLLRVYYARYKDDFLYDCLKFCIPCKCRRKNDHQQSTGQSPGCCPWTCVSNYFDKDEEHVIEVYEEWSKSTMEVDTQMAKLVSALNNKTAESLRILVNSDTSPRGIEVRGYGAIQKCLTDAEIIRSRSKNLWREQDKLMDQLEDIEKQTILKRASFWQSVITVMLYFVFILNSIIVGFGLPGKTENGLGSTGSGMLNENNNCTNL